MPASKLCRLRRIITTSRRVIATVTTINRHTRAIRASRRACNDHSHGSPGTPDLPLYAVSKLQLRGVRGPPVSPFAPGSRIPTTTSPNAVANFREEKSTDSTLAPSRVRIKSAYVGRTRDCGSRKADNRNRGKSLASRERERERNRARWHPSEQWSRL